jgi:hypothetical protein
MLTAWRKKSPGGREALLAGAIGDVADVETRDNFAVAIDVLLSEVAKQTAAAADHLEEAATRVMVVLVLGEVRSQLDDTSGENSDLNFGRPCIRLIDFVLADDFLLAIGLQSQVLEPPAGLLPPNAPVGVLLFLFA